MEKFCHVQAVFVLTLLSSCGEQHAGRICVCDPRDFSNTTYAPPSHRRTGFWRRTVKFASKHLSLNGICAYCMGKYRMSETLQRGERKIRIVELNQPAYCFSSGSIVHNDWYSKAQSVYGLCFLLPRVINDSLSACQFSFS
jgi:hypothetical protein